MGNEMGNRNINGLQASEQESNEDTKVIDQSPNSSFLSLDDLDGLKGISGYLTDGSQTSEKHETENLATGGLSEPSLLFSDVKDLSHSNSTTENDENLESQQFANNEAVQPSVVSEENSTSEKEDVKSLAYDESSTSLCVINKEPADLSSIESLEKDKKLIHKKISGERVSDEESDEVSQAIHESEKALVALNDVQGLESLHQHLPDGPQASEKQGDEKVSANEHLEILAMSSVMDDQICLTSSSEHQDFLNKLSSSTHSKSYEVPIEKETLDDKEKDSENEEAKKFNANQFLKHCAVSDDAEEPTHLFSSTDDQYLHERLSDAAHIESEETLIQKQTFEERVDKDERTWVPGTNDACNEMKDETVQRMNGCVDHNTEHQFLNDTQDLPVQEIETCGPMVLLDNVFEGCTGQDAQQHCEKIDLRGNSSTIPLVGEERESDEQVNAAYLEAIDSEINRLLNKDDLYEVSMPSKIEAKGCEESSNHGKAASGEESKIDDIENDSFDLKLKAINPCEEEREEQEDVGLDDAVFELDIQTAYSSNLMSKEYNKDLEGEAQNVEIGNSTLQTGASVADNKHEEEIECGKSNRLVTYEILGEQLPEVSIATEEILMETKDLSTEYTVNFSKSSESGTENLENKEFSGDVSKEIGKTTEELSENADVESECPDGELNDEIQVVADAVSSHELLAHVISADTTALTSPLLFEKIGQKYNTMEAEALAHKDELFTIDIIQDLSIFPGLPNLSDRTFQSAFVSEEEQQLQDNIHTSLNNMMIQENKQGFIPRDSVLNVLITDPQTLEGCGSFTTELGQDNLKVTTDDSATESVKCLIYESDGSNHGAEENNVTYISALEFPAEETKQNLPLGHEKCKIKALEISKTDENIREYHISTNHEVISKVGDKSEALVLGSTMEESDSSPLLCQRKSEESRVSTEGSDTGKLRTSFSNFLKEEDSAVETVEKEEGLLLKKTVKGSWRTPAKKSMTKSSISREKQKSRSSLFSSCMCCTTAIN